MDFFGDLKQIVITELTQIGIAFDPAADLQDLMLLACNHQLKGITSGKRNIHTSAEFDAALQKLPPAKRAAAKAIHKKFIAGHDLNGHLGSKGNNAKEAGDVDQLLADWGIYHLHISNHKDNPHDNFFARTGPVMFAHVTGTDVYFLNIYPHGAWARQELLQIVERDWPEVYNAHRLKSVTGVRFSPTDDDIKKLRGSAKKGSPSNQRGGAINVILPVGNSFLVSPGGGLASDGTPAANVIRMDKTLYLVRDLEKWANENSAKLKSLVSKHSGVAIAELDFELVPISRPGFGIREKKTGILVYETPIK